MANRHFNQNPTYRTWQHIKQRCCNAKSADYKYYGARGITICDRWKNSFKNFVEDMGEKPKKLSIDRIDNDGNYCKENCRWATKIQQNNNTRRNRKINIDGVVKTLSQWIKEHDVKSSTVRQRFYVYGWNIKKSLGMDN